MGFKKSNPWRWRPGQSGNPAGRPPGIKGFVVGRRFVHPWTQWPKGQSGNPVGRRPGTGIRQRQVRLLDAMAGGESYDFDEAVDVILGEEALLGTHRKGRPRGRPFQKESALPPAACAQDPPATLQPAVPPPPQLPRWLPQFQRPPVPGRDGPDFPRPR